MDLNRKYYVIKEGKPCGSNPHPTFKEALRVLIRFSKKHIKAHGTFVDGMWGIETEIEKGMGKEKMIWRPYSECIQVGYEAGYLKRFQIKD